MLELAYVLLRPVARSVKKYSVQYLTSLSKDEGKLGPRNRKEEGRVLFTCYIDAYAMERTLQHAVEDVAVSYESYRLREQQEECRRQSRSIPPSYLLLRSCTPGVLDSVVVTDGTLYTPCSMAASQSHW